MNLKKPKFWDYKEPNIYAYLLLPLTYLVKILNYFNLKLSKRNLKRTGIKTICIGNIYVGGTGKTSLSIKINEILNKQEIKSCFIKKFYKTQQDEQKLLKVEERYFYQIKEEMLFTRLRNKITKWLFVMMAFKIDQ